MSSSSSGRARSMAFVFDDQSRTLLDELGVLPPAEREALDVEALFERCVTQRLECVRACVAVFVTNEHVLHHAAGVLLKKAAAAEGLEILFDLPARGMTRALIEKLEAVQKPASSVTAEPRLRFAYFDRHVDRSTFHSKVISFHLRSGARRVALTLVGSANFTLGGLRRNDELGILVCREVDGTLDARTGWAALDAALTRYAEDATDITPNTLLPQDADEQRRLQGRIEPFEPDAHLRDYQRDAIKALVDAFHSRRAGGRWRGAMLALPPAAGKTLIALCAAMRLFEGKDRKPIRTAVWLSPTPELARQAFEELDRYFLRREEVEVEAVFLDGRQARTLPGNDTWQLTGDALSELRADDAREVPPRFWFIGKDKLARSQELRLLGAAGVDLLVADEAHHSIAKQWGEVIEALGPRTVFGLTATPYISKPDSEPTKALLNAFPLGGSPWLSYFPEARRNELKATLPKKGGGGNLAYARSARQFIAEDRHRSPSTRVLAEPIFERVQLLDQTGATRLRITPKLGRGLPPHRRLERALEALDDELTGDFHARSIQRHRAEHLKDKVDDADALAAALGAVDRDALESARRRMGDELVVLFARGTSHAELLGRHARAMGIAESNTLVVHSKDKRTPGARRHRIRRLRKNRSGLLICVDMLAEGTDLKEVSHLIITRWTTSERLFWQIVGRGLRGPGSGGTKDVTIRLYDVDFAHTATDARSVEVLDQASAALIEELREADVVVRDEPLIVEGARPRVPVAPALKPRRASSAAKTGARSDYSGAMTDDDIDRFLRGLPGGKYICWVENARTRREETTQIECVSPHAKIRQFAKRHRGAGYRFHVVEMKN